MSYWHCLLFCWSAAFASAQTLHVSKHSLGVGRVAIDLSLNAPEGKAPVALQWEMAFPAQQLAVDDKGPVAGKAATDSGKVLTCAGRWKKAPEMYSYVCILAGGQNPIANGPIAVFAFKRGAKARSGDAHVRVESVQGVTTDLKKMVLKGAATTITMEIAK